MPEKRKSTRSKTIGTKKTSSTRKSVTKTRRALRQRNQRGGSTQGEGSTNGAPPVPTSGAPTPADSTNSPQPVTVTTSGAGPQVQGPPQGPPQAPLTATSTTASVAHAATTQDQTRTPTQGQTVTTTSTAASGAQGNGSNPQGGPQGAQSPADSTNGAQGTGTQGADSQAARQAARLARIRRARRTPAPKAPRVKPADTSLQVPTSGTGTPLIPQDPGGITPANPLPTGVVGPRRVLPSGSNTPLMPQPRTDLSESKADIPPVPPTTRRLLPPQLPRRLPQQQRGQRSQGNSLYVASSQGNSTEVERLLATPQNTVPLSLSSRVGGYTPLDAAAYKGNLAIVKALVESVNNETQRINMINEPDTSTKITPLYSAALGDHDEVVDYLIKQGATVDKMVATDQHGNGYTPLHGAVHFGKSKAVKVLLEGGADISIKTPSGNTIESLLNKDNQEANQEIRRLLKLDIRNFLNSGYKKNKKDQPKQDYKVPEEDSLRAELKALEWAEKEYRKYHNRYLEQTDNTREARKSERLDNINKKKLQMIADSARLRSDYQYLSDLYEKVMKDEESVFSDRLSETIMNISKVKREIIRLEKAKKQPLGIPLDDNISKRMNEYHRRITQAAKIIYGQQQQQQYQQYQQYQQDQQDQQYPQYQLSGHRPSGHRPSGHQPSGHRQNRSLEQLDSLYYEFLNALNDPLSKEDANRCNIITDGSLCNNQPECMMNEQDGILVTKGKHKCNTKKVGGIIRKIQKLLDEIGGNKKQTYKLTTQRMKRYRYLRTMCEKMRPCGRPCQNVTKNTETGMKNECRPMLENYDTTKLGKAKFKEILNSNKGMQKADRNRLETEKKNKINLIDQACRNFKKGTERNTCLSPNCELRRTRLPPFKKKCRITNETKDDINRAETLEALKALNLVLPQTGGGNQSRTTKRSATRTTKQSAKRSATRTTKQSAKRSATRTTKQSAKRSNK